MRRDVAQLADGTFDLLVVGGGVYGAWTAYDAALRGMRVAIVERDDWAAGTSSASSKLIHGGLRYLEYAQFGLVRKALAERNLLRRLGPHRVRRLRFAIPLYGSSRWLRLKLRVGLALYDRMARSGRPSRGHEALSASELARRYDFLERADLAGGFTYGDCQTDDARLVLELVSGAVAAGAVAANYAGVTELLASGGAVAGARVDDRAGGATHEVRARAVALCAGAWNGALAPAGGRAVETRFSKGVHLVLPALSGEDAFLLLTGERGRVVFLIPWNGRTLVGTTDTDYDGDPADARCLPADETYLLEHANRALDGRHRWTESDVIGRFAGLRTFPAAKGRTSALSRDWRVVEPLAGAFASVGGKLTSARVDAARLVDRVSARLGGRSVPCPTAARPLPWRPQERYRPWQQRTLDRALRRGLDEETAVACQRRYGARISRLLDMCEKLPELTRRFVPELPFCTGELAYGARDEMVCRLDDLLRRRLPLARIAALPAERVELAAAIAGKMLGWSRERREDEVRDVRARGTSA